MTSFTNLKLYNYIVSIQKGEIEDPFGWVAFVTVARLYVRDKMTAEDIVADSFVQLYTHVEDIPEDMIIGAYLMTIVKNKCLNYLKQKETHSRIEVEMLRSLQTLEPRQIFYNVIPLRLTEKIPLYQLPEYHPKCPHGTFLEKSITPNVQVTMRW